MWPFKKKKIKQEPINSMKAFFESNNKPSFGITGEQGMENILGKQGSIGLMRPIFPSSRTEIH
jgi:hypothetical protein